MKSLFFSVTLALVAPLAACTSNTPVASNITQSPIIQATSVSKITKVSLTQDWYNYTAKDGTYTAKFPGKPIENNNSRKTEMGEIKFLQVMYQDKDKNLVYMTQSNNYPVPPDQYNAEQGLDGARDSQVKGGKTLLSEKKITLNGLPGRELMIKDQKGITMKTRLFIDPKGPTMYLAIVGSENGKVDFPEATAFLDSLAVSK